MLPPPRTIPKGKNSLMSPGTFPPAQSSCHHLQVCPCHLLSLLPAVPPPCSAHSSALLLLIKKIINPSSLMALWHWGLHKKAQEEQGTSVSPLLVALPPPFPPSQSLCRNLGARPEPGRKGWSRGVGLGWHKFKNGNFRFPWQRSGGWKHHLVPGWKQPGMLQARVGQGQVPAAT